MTEQIVPISVIKEGQWAEVKGVRDRLLSETDFTQIPDSPLSTEKKAEFSEYRQKLRDIPQAYTDPLDVVWPDKPTI